MSRGASRASCCRPDEGIEMDSAARPPLPDGHRRVREARLPDLRRSSRRCWRSSRARLAPLTVYTPGRSRVSRRGRSPHASTTARSRCRGTTRSRPCRRCCASSTASSRSARARLACAGSGRRSRASQVSGPGFPNGGRAAARSRVDPDLAPDLAVRFGAAKLRARRVELAALEDEIEALFERGWSDGLPLVPPTEKRVLAMLEGTTREPQRDRRDGAARPRRRARVEKVAINAVMAGCKPEYLPVVLAAVEAACTTSSTCTACSRRRCRSARC